MDANRHKQILWQGAASGASQLIGLLALAVVAKLLGPAVVGGFYMFSTTSTALSTLTTLSLPTVVLAARSTVTANRVSAASLRVSILLGAVATLIIWTVADTDYAYLSLAGPMAALSAIIAARQALLFRVADFPSVNRLTFAQGFAVALARAGAAVAGAASAASLALMSLIATLPFALLSWGGTTLSNQRANRQIISWRSDLAVLRRYRTLVVNQTLQQTLNAASIAIPVSLFADYFGLQEAGVLSLAMALTGLPAQVFGRAIGDRFLAEYSRGIRKDATTATRLLTRWTVTLGAIGLLPYTLMAMAAPLVVQRALGESWSQTAEFVTLLALWQYSVFINPPGVKALVVLGRQPTATAVNAFTLCLRLTAIFVGAIEESSILAVACFAGAGIVHNLGIMYLARMAAISLAKKGST